MLALLAPVVEQEKFSSTVQVSGLYLTFTSSLSNFAVQFRRLLHVYGTVGLSIKLHALLKFVLCTVSVGLRGRVGGLENRNKRPDIPILVAVFARTWSSGG